MNLRRFVLALAGMAMLAAIFAGNAAAKVETLETHWWIEGKGKLKAGETEFVKCSIGEHPAGEKKLVLSSVVLGVPIKITATGIDCINHEGEVGANGTAKIVQEGNSAQDRQRWHFTNVTVSEPANCEVENGTILTNPLKSEVFHHSEKPEIIFKKFEPTPGFNFANIRIVGPNCPIAGVFPLKGFVYGEFELRTKVFAVNQPLTFSEPVDVTAGSALTLGANPAHLTGTLNTELAGVNAGKKWG